MNTSPRLAVLFALLASAAACGGGSGTDEATSSGASGDGGSGGAAGKAGGGASGAAGSGASGGKAGSSGSSAGSAGQGTAGQAGGAGKGGAGQGGAGQGGAAQGGAGQGGMSGGAGQGGAAQGGTSGGAGQGAGGQGGAAQGGAAGQGAGGASAGMSGAAGAGAGGAAGASGAAGAAGAAPCGGCKDGFQCKYGVCVPVLGACGVDDDCPGDSYCEPNEFDCIPYGVPADKINDPTCQKDQVPTDVTPTVQCEWTGPAAGDPTETMVETYSTPLVADLNLDLDPKKIRPSIILTTFDFSYGGSGRTGLLRVFDGRTCEEQMRIGGPDDPDADGNRPGYVGGWAVGDLDGDVGTPDGHPEIVGFHRVGLSSNSDPLSVIAFGIDTSDPSNPKLVRRWTGRDCSNDKPVTFLSNAANLALALHDLDDDGKPEVVFDRLVFDSEGCVQNPSAASKLTSYDALGIINTVADVDLDGTPDLVHFDGVYGWDSAAKDWVLKPWAVVSAGLTAGNVAVADVGYYSDLPGRPKTDPLPEIIVAAGGMIRVQTLKGDIVFGPFPINQGGRGGPPTAADFDGDGQVEFAAAGASAYTVYDPDCLAKPDGSARPGGVCMKSNAALPEGILWAQPSQDQSSNCTGSSVFDFNGDGKAEVVYRDECFVRVYDGKSGTVLYSSPASSGTGYEYPVIADVDGDFATEIVVPRTKGITCPAGPDKLFPGSGDFQLSSGFVVLRDPEDRWVASRPVWNQHAYSITNVTDDARIPKSSQVLRNWEQPGLNNFRQNTQGALAPLALADLTVELQDADSLCEGQAGSFEVKASVCNRGTNPVQDGAKVVFTQGKKGQPASPLCETATDTLLAPGDCTIVTCTGELEADNDVLVTVDPDKAIADCHPGNNAGASARVLCGKP
jgi:hypothetical protein